MKPETFLDIVKPKESAPSMFRLGTITSDYVSGRPKVLFDGETIASSRTYPYLSSYTPAANDRVQVAVVGHGFIIQGKII